VRRHSNNNVDYPSCFVDKCNIGRHHDDSARDLFTPNPDPE
jgi:hypothetical protein